MLVGGVIAIVPAILVGANPSGLWAVVLPLSLMLGAALLQRKRAGAAAASVLAFLLAATFLALVVAASPRATSLPQLHSNEGFRLELPDRAPSSGS